MLDALRKRFEDDEEGFTLIELMVVVLIIGILVAIAVPTFLNAQDNAKSKAAQSNARSALSASKTMHAENETYEPTIGALAALQAAEPSLDWQAEGAASTKVDEISWVANDKDITIAVRANNGDCFFIRDSVDTSVAATRGTYFGKLTATAVADGCDANGTLPTFRQSQSDGWPKSGPSVVAPVAP